MEVNHIQEYLRISEELFGSLRTHISWYKNILGGKHWKREEKHKFREQDY